MVFNSLAFFPFFLFLLALYYLSPSNKMKKLLLLMGSYVFYGFFNPWFVPLLAVTTIFTWIVTENIKSLESIKLAGWGVFVPLLFLAVFKYSAFVVGNLSWITNYWGIERSWSIVDIALPVGISFYIFQSISYVVDVYRGGSKAKLLDYALYVSFFPQLVAGPIVRAGDFLPQTRDPVVGKINRDKIEWGLTLLLFGLFQKVVLADGVFAQTSEQVFNSELVLSAQDAWVGALAFTGQIYFDFAGYSTCAIGVALCFGYRLPINFSYPYAAIGFSDFWRRWHISLSSWLRDYLYIPLGGNRNGRWLTYRNLFLTMLLGGLWHGAAWTFVIWGGLHGIYLAVERGLRSHAFIRRLTIPAFTWAMTFLFTVIAWVFFRAETFPKAIEFLKSMFLLNPSTEQGLITNLDKTIVLVMIFGTLIYSGFMRQQTIGQVWTRTGTMNKALILGILLASLIIWRGPQIEFIYFQF